MLVSVAACGGSRAQGIDGDAAADGGSEASDASASRPTASCRAGEPGAVPCHPTTEMCIDDYAGVGGFDPHQQCKPLPEPCLDDHTCACVAMHFRCGITTTCSEAEGGMVSVTCQPD